MDVHRGLNLILAGHRQLMTLFIPLALGAGAWQARRDRRSRMDELVATTALPRRHRVLPTAVALAIGIVAGFWVVLAGLTVYGAAVDAYLSPAVVPIALVASLYLAAAAILGMGIGSRLPWVLTPPLLVVVGFVTMFLQESRFEGPDVAPSGWDLLLPSLIANDAAFTAMSWRMVAIQTVSAVAVAAAGYVLLAAGRRATAAAALAPLLLGAAIVVPLVPADRAAGFVADRGALALVCTDDAPRVCVTRAHHRALEGLVEPGRAALAVLGAKLPAAPGSVVETPSGFPRDVPQTEALYADVWIGGKGQVENVPADLPWFLLMGAGTRWCDNAPPWPSAERTRYDAARLVAAAWLLDREPLAPTDRPEVWGDLPPISMTLPAYEALRALPADEQRARVAALRASEIACDGRDRLGILTG